MTAMMPPAGTSNAPSDQTSLPPRTTLTSSKVRAAALAVPVGAGGGAGASDGDTERLGEGGQLGHLPSLERIGARRHRFGDLDHRDAGRLCGLADLLGDRALRLGVVDQHVD